nr:transmembrane protein 19 isoform X1 [Caretta caretta]XP_048691724.1 transmembrane protein 19 isoform X1 [Caretta caretta]XP_048691725.1 transmembrane protein 19 isoform X1 [Caretta caretta]
MAVASYCLFRQEMPHTANGRPTLSALSLVHPEAEHWFRTGPANAHYLSARNSTDWLEAWSVTAKDSTVEKVKNSLATFKKLAYMADECTDANDHQVLSHCVRYLDVSGRPVDAFLDVQVIEDTSAASVTTHILELNACQLDPRQMSACEFDGAANFSGRHGGVQALLRENYNPNLSYTHCRGHLLQLALVRAAESSKDIKKAINVMSSLYSFFSKSPKRLTILENIEDPLGLKLKLVQPRKTRWLSHEQSLAVVLKLLQPLLLALESIYQDGMDLSSEAGGLLLLLHSEKTIAILSLVSLLLKPIGSLNNAIQASATTVVDLCPAIEATFGSIRELSIEKVLEEAKTSVQKLTNEGIYIES